MGEYSTSMGDITGISISTEWLLYHIKEPSRLLVFIVKSHTILTGSANNIFAKLLLK